MSRPDTNESERDEELFVRLLTQHENDLHRYIMSIVFDASAVDDIMQDVAIVVWKKFGEYDKDRPFFPWACRFAYFQVLKYRTKIGRSRLVFADNLVELLAADYEAERESLIARRRALDHCLAKLSQSDQELLQRRYGSNETIGDLAKSTNVSVHKLYHALERIRRWLLICAQKTLKEEGYGELA